MFHRSSMPAALAVCLLAACDGAPTATDATGSAATDLPSEVQTSRHATTAVVTFGRNDLGTDFFPPGSHDQSLHAKFAIRPRTTVIATGGTVTFQVQPLHKIAIYQPGIGPDDIDVASVEFVAGFPAPIINSAAGRIVRGPLVLGTPADFDWTFTAPGRYLVICEVLPHFAVGKMYAWIEVK